jgi:PRC-barrel domain protein
MEALDNLLEEQKKGLIHHDVVDEKNHKVGSVHSFRINEESGKSDFVVVSSGWLFGHFFLVPTATLTVAPDLKRLQLPFERKFVEAAPTLHNAKIITLTDMTHARRYFLGETPTFKASDLAGAKYRYRRPPGYDPSDTGITKI